MSEVSVYLTRVSGTGGRSASWNHCFVDADSSNYGGCCHFLAADCPYEFHLAFSSVHRELNQPLVYLSIMFFFTCIVRSFRSRTSFTSSPLRVP